MVCFESDDLIITVDLIHNVTQLPIPSHHAAPLALINYMPLIGVWCTEMDHGLRANTTFRNVHGVGRWIQATS